MGFNLDAGYHLVLMEKLHFLDLHLCYLSAMLLQGPQSLKLPVTMTASAQHGFYSGNWFSVSKVMQRVEMEGFLNVLLFRCVEASRSGHDCL
jgi:hypothetical protein